MLNLQTIAEQMRQQLLDFALKQYQAQVANINSMYGTGPVATVTASSPAGEITEGGGAASGVAV